MSCYMKIGRFTDRDIGFPCDPLVMDAIQSFKSKAKVNTIVHDGPGIVPAINTFLNSVGATEWICTYSNKVTLSTQLTIYYR